MSDSTQGHPHDDELPTVARESLNPTRQPATPASVLPGVPAAPPGYEIVRELNRGGMGVVYLARQARLHRDVALKMIPSADPMDLVRFLAEAENAASVDHPHVVRVYDFGQHDGRPFLAMEYLPGSTLGERVRSGGPLTPRDAATVMAKVADGVAAAHRAGIVHRDLKPGNVLFDAAGDPKVCDFGLAKRGVGQNLTRTEAVMGTPAYMAPEQARGESKLAGPAADVWGLGVILYECLAGVRPFVGADPWSILNNVMSTVPPPLRTTRSSIPRDLETICLKCLSKSPTDRYPSAAELAADLRLFLDGRPITARPIGWLGHAWRSCARHPALATTLAALALVTAVVPPVLWSYQGRVDALHAAREAEESLRAGEERARRAAEENAAAQEYFARLNRARRLTAAGAAGWRWPALDDLAAAARTATPVRDNVDLRTAIAECEAGVDVREVALLGPVTHLSGSMLATSPDGRTLAVVDRRASATWVSCRLRLYDIATRALTHDLTFPSGLISGDATLSLKPDGARVVAFSPDGRFLFVGTRSGRVHRWKTTDPASGPATWIGPESTVTGIAFDGETVAVAHHNGDLNLRSVDGDGTPRTTVRISGDNWAGDITYVGVTPPTAPATVGPPAYFVNISRTTVALDPATARLLPNPVQWWRDRPELPPGLGGLVYHAPTRSVFGHSSEVVYRIDAAAGVQTQQFQDRRSPATLVRLAVSPDGALLAAVTTSGHLKLWTTHDSRLVGTVPLGEAFDVSFATDGRTLFVAADRGLLVFEVGGLTAHRAVAAHARPVRGFAPGPEPTSLVVAAATDDHGDGSRAELMVASENGTAAVRVPLPRSGVRTDCPMVHHMGTTTLTIAPGGDQLWFADPFAGLIHPVVKSGTDVAAVTAAAGERQFWAAAGSAVVLRSAHDGVEIARWTNLLDVTSGRGGVQAVAARGDTVMVGCRDGRVAFLRNPSAETVALRPGPGGPVTAVAVVDRGLALAGNLSGQLRGYSLPDAEAVFTTPAHADQVHSIAVSPRGNLVATAGRDSQVVLWANAGRDLRRLVSLTAPGAGTLLRVAFSSDGERLLVHHQGEFGVRCWHIGRLREGYRAIGIDW